jgi:hypothetical protein
MEPRNRFRGIDFASLCIACRADTTNRIVVPVRQAVNRFLGSLKGLQIRAQIYGRTYSYYLNPSTGGLILYHRLNIKLDLLSIWAPCHVMCTAVLIVQQGRATVELQEARFDLQPSLTKRLKYVMEIKKKFWDKWTAQVFQGQVLAKE